MSLSTRFASIRASWAGEPLRPFQTAFFLFLPSGFLIRPTSVWAWTFYALFIPTLVRFLYRRGAGALRSSGAVLAFVTCIYFLLTLTWGESAGHAATFKWLMSSIWTMIFIAGCIIFFSGQPDIRDRFFDALTIVAAINAILSLLIYAWAPPDVGRLGGFAETRHQILGASIIGVCTVVTFYRLLSDPGPIKGLLRTGCLLLFTVFIVMTSSRGPLLALLGGALTYLCALDRKKALIAVAILIALGCLIIVLDPDVAPLRRMMTRDSHRLQIWADALGAIQLRPFFGHGLAARFNDDPIFSFPHSLYMSGLFYGGGVGLLLIVALFAKLGRDLATTWDSSSGPFRLALLAHTILSGITDLGQPVKGPSELWFILWLPVTTLIGMNLWMAKHALVGRLTSDRPRQ
jgi:O-antigen ligase